MLFKFQFLYGKCILEIIRQESIFSQTLQRYFFKKLNFEF